MARSSFSDNFSIFLIWASSDFSLLMYLHLVSVKIRYASWWYLLLECTTFSRGKVRRAGFRIRTFLGKDILAKIMDKTGMNGKGRCELAQIYINVAIDLSLWLIASMKSQGQINFDRNKSKKLRHML